MTLNDIELKQAVFIKYLKDVLSDTTYNPFKIKAEYSTNDNDKKVIIVQEQAGEKVVFYGDISPLYNYYEIVIFGSSIREEKDISTLFGELIGSNNIINYNNANWQVMIKQLSNPQTIEYQDIRRVGYSMIFQTIVNKINEECEA